MARLLNIIGHVQPVMVIMLRRMAGIWLGAKPQLRIIPGDIRCAGLAADFSFVEEGVRRVGYLARR